MKNKWTHIVAAAAAMWAIGTIAVITTHAQAQAPPGAATPTQTAPSTAPAPGTSAASPSSVWSGVYTEAQATRGEAIANKMCASCHGPELSGGEAGPALVGLEFLGNWTSLSLADFFDRVQATMPADAPGTLSTQQTTDLTTYVLKLNKYPAGQTELTTDVAMLKQIKIEGQPPPK